MLTRAAACASRAAAGARPPSRLATRPATPRSLRGAAPPSAAAGDDAPSTSGAPGDAPSAAPAPPRLDKAARSSETQAVNLRAVAPADGAGAAAASFAKAIRAGRPGAGTGGGGGGGGGPPAPSPAARRLVLGGGDDTEDKWRALDERVNEYPDRRVFKGIGVAGADAGLFRRAIVAAVESVVGPVDDGDVSVRDSSGGKYVSVTVGPVIVESGDEVVAVFAAMRELAGPMLKFYL